MTTAVSPSQQFRPQVLEFAQRHGIAAVLPLVGDLTERLFSMAQAIDVELVTDDEQPDQQTIFFMVRGLDIDPRLGSDLHWQWASDLQHVCPNAGRALMGLELCWAD